MPQRDVVLHPRAPQIEVPVLQPRVFGDAGFIRDWKGRRLRVVQQPDLADGHLDLAGLYLRIHRLRRPQLHLPEDGDDVLRPHPLRVGQDLLVISCNDLREAMTVAYVEKHERPEVAHAVHPSEEHDVRAHILARERAAGVRARELTERLNHRFEYLV